jgi:hypothetical protein
MKPVTGAMRFFLFLLLSLAGLLLAARDQVNAIEGSTGRYVFEYCHSSYNNSGSVKTNDGFFIDNDGAVWSYDHGDYQWSPTGNEGLFYENDLYDKYRNLKQIGSVDKSVLSAMASLIEPASGGETAIRGRQVDGMDSMSYSAYLYDPGQDTYKEILLFVRGSGAEQNTSSAARTLVPWLESVFFSNRKTPEPVPSGVPQPAPAAGTRVRELRVIQKMPAPKPEIKGVEIRGPFPIEDRSQ